MDSKISSLAANPAQGIATEARPQNALDPAETAARAADNHSVLKSGTVKPVNSNYPLEPRGDTTVSKIIGRYETRALKAAEAKVDTLLMQTYYEAFKGFEKSPKLSRDELQAFAKTVRREFSTPGFSLYYHFEDSIKKHTSPSFEAYCLHLASHNLYEDGNALMGHVQIRSTSCLFTRKSLEYTTCPMSCDWRHHAAERLHERGIDRGDAHMTIAIAIMQLYPLINTMAEQTIGKDIDLQVAVPAGGGLLYGALGLKSRHDHYRGNAGLKAMFSYGKSGPDVEESATSHHACSFAKPMTGNIAIDREAYLGAPIWTALTYIGPKEIQPEQQDYINRFYAVADKHFPHRADLALASYGKPPDEAYMDWLQAATKTNVQPIGGIVPLMPRHDLYQLDQATQDTIRKDCQDLTDFAIDTKVVKIVRQDRKTIADKMEKSAKIRPTQSPFHKAILKHMKRVMPETKISDDILKYAGQI